uniref:Uncharacterized protein n=1 Tax=Rhizophora mucronata TaxID=61149 RepID=A0A2P2MIL0_RHIMU
MKPCKLEIGEILIIQTVKNNKFQIPKALRATGNLGFS